MSNRGQRRFVPAQVSPGAFYLLLAEIGLSLVFLLSSGPLRVELANWFVATADHVWSDFKIWTLVTSPLVNDNLISLLFHGLILWMFVPVLERWWGTRKFLLFALWTSLAGTLAGTLLGAVLGSGAAVNGLDPFIYACIIAYGILYADQKVQFFGVLPMTGRQLMLGMTAVAALFVLIGGQWVQGAAYAAAMSLAWLLTNGKWTPRLGYLRWKQRRLRRHLRIVKDRDERDEPDKWLN
jgi:membrane associated rhomboid family serine protease